MSAARRSVGRGKRRTVLGRREEEPGARRLAAPIQLALLALLGLAAGCGEAEVERPVPLFDAVPIQYPLELWDADVEGTTVVRVRVDTEGRVDSAAVLETSGHAAFDSAALGGARELRFRPGLREGEPVPVWAEIPVHFSKDSTP